MKKLFILPLYFTFVFQAAISAQDFAEAHRKIRQAFENRDYSGAAGELQTLQKRDKKIFELNNYDYLLARVAEKRGDFALAAANYQSAAARDSILKEYALWHLAQIARSSGNLMLERLFLQEILAFAPHSLLTEAANARLARSYLESKNYDSAIRLLENDTGTPGRGDAENKNNISPTKNEGQMTKDKKLKRENLVL